MGCDWGVMLSPVSQLHLLCLSNSGWHHPLSPAPAWGFLCVAVLELAFTLPLLLGPRWPGLHLRLGIWEWGPRA